MSVRCRCALFPVFPISSCDSQWWARQERQPVDSTDPLPYCLFTSPGHLLFAWLNGGLKLWALGRLALKVNFRPWLTRLDSVPILKEVKGAQSCFTIHSVTVKVKRHLSLGRSEALSATSCRLCLGSLSCRVAVNRLELGQFRQIYSVVSYPPSYFVVLSLCLCPQSILLFCMSSNFSDLLESSLNTL